MTTLALVGLVACGGDDSGAGDGLDAFTYEAAQLCSDTINDFDAAVASAALGANLDVVALAASGDAVDPTEALEYADQMDAYRAELEAARVALAALEADTSEDQEAWDGVVASLDPHIEQLERRAGLLRAIPDGGTLDPDEVRIGGTADDDRAVSEAIAQLGLEGRDCERLGLAGAAPTEYEGFIDAAASACTTIVSRRRAAGFSTNRTLGALKQLLEEEDVTITPELQAEVEAAAEEWQRTADELAAVPTDHVPDAELWQDVLDAAAERADVYERRAEALDSGDQAAVAAVFTPDVYRFPSLGDMRELGLDWRDCRLIES